MTADLEFDLLDRLRSIVGGEPATESELRALDERAAAWQRILQGQLERSEARLARLTRRPQAPQLAATAELRRIDALRPQLAELAELRAALDRRSRQLRSSWLSGQLPTSP